MGSFPLPRCCDRSRLESDRRMEAVDSVVFTPVIAAVIALCNFPADSVMVQCIQEEGWSTLLHVLKHNWYGIEDMHTIGSDDNSKVKPLVIHKSMLQGVILYHKRKYKV